MSVKNNTLDELTDKQKSLLTQFAYINYNMDKYRESMENGKMSIADLEKILENEDEPYLGKFANKVTGIKVTPKQIIKELKESGLENLEIKEILQDKSTGFFALTIQDKIRNKGIIFRGTEVSNLRDLITDSITDAKEYIVDNAKQVQQAKQFYNKNKSKEGLNYLLGHSLGGNLVEHIYLEDYENIQNVFAINPNHINQELLNTDEKKLAFNNPEKFNCNVVGGDWVSELKNSCLFENNIKYVKNNQQLKSNIFSEHAIEAATYDEEGNFLTTTKELAYKGHTHKIQRFFTRALAKAGNIVKRAYEKANRSLSLEPKEVKALPEPKKEKNIKTDLTLENFKTSEKDYDAKQAYENLSTIGKQERKEEIKINQEKSLSCK